LPAPGAGVDGRVSEPGNAAQVRRWNGPDGQRWIAQRERHLAEHQHLTPHLFRAAGISPGERVLDVGCGCGDTTIAAARAARGDDGRRPGQVGGAVGLDLSGPMLGVARQLAGQAGAANAWFVCADAQACPLRRASFDVMISKFGTLFFDDPRAAFAAIGATLRPNGRLAFLCWQDDPRNELFALPKQAFAAHVPAPDPADGDLFADPEQISRLLTSTGWTGIEITAVTEPARLGSDVDDVMTYVRGMNSVRTLTASLADQAVAERVLAALAEQYAARQRPDGVWVEAAAWLVTARRS
jgi:ubiquinone/menaquinone biosynthesis C-methylase UbiE